MANPTSQVKVQQTPVTEENAIVELKGGSAYTIYVGEMVGKRTDGFYAKCDDSAVLEFAGIAQEQKSVLAADADGAIKLLIKRPLAFSVTKASAVQADIGKAAYALFSNEVTVTPGSTTNANKIGKIVEQLDGSTVMVAPDRRGEQAAITSLTDNTGGTATDTLADTPGAYSEAYVADSLASLAAKVNAILAALKREDMIA